MGGAEGQERGGTYILGNSYCASFALESVSALSQAAVCFLCLLQQSPSQLTEIQVNLARVSLSFASYHVTGAVPFGQSQSTIFGVLPYWKFNSAGALVAKYAYEHKQSAERMWSN